MWQVIGQNRQLSLLQGALKAGSLSHAYLFIGPPHVGKMTLALDLARAVNCTGKEKPCGKCPSCKRIDAGRHADIQVIGMLQNDKGGESKLIGIDQIKDMQHSASLPPFEGMNKVYIIDGAETLSTEAANCLLKTLEEPAANVVFILLTTNESLLLPTVISRCQRLELRPMPIAEEEQALITRWEIPAQKAALLARLSHGCPGWAVTIAGDNTLLDKRNEEIDKLLSLIKADYDERFEYAYRLFNMFNQGRSQVTALFDLWLDFWRDLLLVKTGCNDLVTNIDRMDAITGATESFSLEDIENFITTIQAAALHLNQNASPRLVFEVLMLDMPRREMLASKPR